MFVSVTAGGTSFTGSTANGVTSQRYSYCCQTKVRLHFAIFLLRSILESSGERVIFDAYSNF